MKHTNIGIMTAAGKGTRMGGIHPISKCLIKVGGIPIIEHGILSLQKANVKEIFIVILEKHHDDFLYLKNKYKNLHLVTIKKTNHIMESAIKVFSEAKNYLFDKYEIKNIKFIYWLADNLLIGDTWLKAIKHLSDKMSTNIKIKQTGFLTIKNNSPQDFIAIDNGEWKDKYENPSTNIVAIGVFILNWSATNDMSLTVKNRKGEYTIFDSWMCDHKILSYPISDTWIDVGTPERYIFAEKLLK